MLYALDLMGTFIFAVSGAFRAVKHELDLLGVLVLATATGVGGGILRDIMLGSNPPAAFRDEWYLLSCIAGGLAVFFGARKIAARWNVVMEADAVGLAVFAALGAAKAADSGLGVIGIIMMAALTASGGGMVRDILVAEIPMILKADFYATAAIIGGACFVGARELGLPQGTQVFGAMAVTLALRIIAMRYGLALPHARKLPLSPSRITLMRQTGQAAPDSGTHDAGHRVP